MTADSAALVPEVVITHVRRQMFDRVPKGSARHGCGIAIEVVAQPLLVSLSGFPNPAAHRFLNHVVRVVRKNLRNAEGVVEITAAHEEPSAHDGGAPLVPAWTLGQQVERPPGLVPQISTYDMWGGSVDEVPGVNAVMPAQIQLV
jgi:hypothetical protein